MMCETCDRAARQLEGLRQRWQGVRPNNSLAREAHGQLRSQIVRAEEDLVRLRESLHGRWVPRPQGQQRTKPDKLQMGFDL